MLNLFRRLHELNTPVLKLNDRQEKSIEHFREKVEQGIYKFEKKACLCGNENGFLIAERDRFALDVKTFLCRCGILWTNPQMTEESLARFYDEDYRAIYVGEEKATDVFFDEQVLRGEGVFSFLKTELDSVRNGRFKVFDVGCGAGGILVPFKNAGMETYGCDIGQSYLEFGRAKGLSLFHGTAAVLKEYGPADLILLNHVLEHIKDPQSFLENLKSLIADNGLLYIELPGIMNIHKVYKKDFLLFLQNAHLYHFTLNTLNSLMSRAGFELIKGDQMIRAIFRKSKKAAFKTNKVEFYKVFLYLYFLELGNRAKPHI